MARARVESEMKMAKTRAPTAQHEFNSVDRIEQYTQGERGFRYHSVLCIYRGWDEEILFGRKMDLTRDILTAQLTIFLT